MVWNLLSTFLLDDPLWASMIGQPHLEHGASKELISPCSDIRNKKKDKKIYNASSILFDKTNGKRASAMLFHFVE